MMTMEQNQKFAELTRLDSKLDDIAWAAWQNYKKATDKYEKDDYYSRFLKARRCRAMLDRKIRPYIEMMKER